jgi:hypothetical protein
MNRILASICLLGLAGTLAAQYPKLHVRAVYAPSVDEGLGLGLSYRGQGRWFHQLEVYPFYTVLNQAIPTVTERSALGLTYRAGYNLRQPEKALQPFVAVQGSWFTYSRTFTDPPPAERLTTHTTLLLGMAGADLRIAERLHVNAALMLAGVDFSAAETRVIVNGPLGVLLPWVGVEIGLF